MWSIFSSKLVRYPSAFALSLWIAGIGCIFGCEGRVAGAVNHPAYEGQQSEHARLAAGHSCSSAGFHSCCAKNAQSRAAKPGWHRSPTGFHGEIQKSWTAEDLEPKLSTTNNPSSGLKDCPFAVSRITVAAQGRNLVMGATPAVSHTSLHTASSLRQRLILSGPSRVSNRGHTYLRCCVFLI